MYALLTAINSKYIHTALGLRYVAKYARKNSSHQIDLLEETINTPIFAVLEKIMASSAAVYGFSVHIWNKDFVFRLIRMLKKLRPEAVVVIGGPEVAFDVQRIFDELPQADYIIEGEGEQLFTALLDALKAQASVPCHIAHKENGAVCVNGGVAVLDDLSQLPFPYPDLEEVVAANKIVYYESTRGCPFNCSYCLSGISRSVRRRPLELVLRDMDRFMAAKAPLVKFVDRTYNLDEKYFLPMMEYLAAVNTNTTFHFEVKADLLSEKVLAFLKTVPQGRFQLEIGVQTTNPTTLRAINRYDDWERLVHNCRYLLDCGNMHLHLDLIAGLPYEGLAEFAKSFNDVYSLQPQMLQLGFLKVLPGTQMSHETRQHGLRYMDEPPYEILATNYMPYNDMQFLKRLENIFEQTYNTGVFNNILRLLVDKLAPDAFSFYTQLTNWWAERGYYPQSHNARSVTRILYEYIEEFGGADKDIFIEVLRYDVFCGIDGWYPEWLYWNTKQIFDAVSEFWRNEKRVQQYIDGYKFTSWRQIHKNYPIELFRIDVKTGKKQKCYIMKINTADEAQLITIEL